MNAFFFVLELLCSENGLNIPDIPKVSFGYYVTFSEGVVRLLFCFIHIVKQNYQVTSFILLRAASCSFYCTHKCMNLQKKVFLPFDQWHSQGVNLRDLQLILSDSSHITDSYLCLKFTAVMLDHRWFKAKN